jgi:hypothetical protein
MVKTIQRLAQSESNKVWRLVARPLALVNAIEIAMLLISTTELLSRCLSGIIHKFTSVFQQNIAEIAWSTIVGLRG